MMDLAEARVLLRRTQELLERTQKDHSLRLDASRSIEFIQAVKEIGAALGQGDEAGVAKSVDAVGLGPAAARRGGSSPSARTITIHDEFDYPPGEAPKEITQEDVDRWHGDDWRINGQPDGASPRRRDCWGWPI